MSVPSEDLPVHDEIPPKKLNTETPQPQEDFSQNLAFNIKHLEYSINQNRKKFMLICKEIFNAMRLSESLAFDLLLSEYLFGNTSPQQIYNFIDSCIKPNFNLASGDPRETDAIANHIRSVQTQIQKSIVNLTSIDNPPNNPQKNTADFAVFLKEQKQKLETDIKRIQEQHQTTSQPKIINLSFATEDRELAKEELSPDFEEWINRELKFDVESTDDETVKNRSIFSMIIHRLKSIHSLKKEISQLQKTKIRNFQYTDCDPNNFYNSPYYKMIKENCKFLITSLNSIRTTQHVIPYCISEIDKAKNNLNNITNNHQQSLNQIKKTNEELQTQISNRKEKINELIKKNKTFIDSFNFDIENLQIDSTKEKTDELDTEIEEHFKKLISSSTDPTTQETLQSHLKSFIEYRELRKSITKLCETSINTIKTNIKLEKELFQTIIEHCKDEEILMRRQKEFEELTKYEKTLYNVLDLMQIDKINDWCNKLNKTTNLLITLINNQNEIVLEFEPFVNSENFNEEISELEKEVNEIIAENAKLIEEEAQIKLEIEKVEEERIKEQFIESCDVSADEDITICPICRCNERNVILKTCFHPFCRRCVEESNHLCPICKIKFEDDDIKNMYFQ